MYIKLEHNLAYNKPQQPLYTTRSTHTYVYIYWCLALHQNMPNKRQTRKKQWNSLYHTDYTTFRQHTLRYCVNDVLTKNSQQLVYDTIFMYHYIVGPPFLLFSCYYKTTRSLQFCTQSANIFEFDAIYDITFLLSTDYANWRMHMEWKYEIV